MLMIWITRSSDLHSDNIITTTVLESTLLWSEESVEDVFSYESVLNYYEIESLLQNSFALFC